jgi:Ca2+-binding RTX toxin-like protein
MALSRRMRRAVIALRPVSQRWRRERHPACGGYADETGNNILNGGAGNDDLNGSDGNDVLYGGDGSDTLRGDSWDGVLAADTFVFKSGDTGVDTVQDFHATSGDKLDIHDILSNYDPLTSDITDYVQITASGSNAIVSVDLNGPTGGSSYVQIATLTGASALAGHEADLLANGNLIAA